MNKTFFEQENPWKYYVLGWILSDGHVSKNRNFWSINVHAKDKTILQKITNIVGHTGKIYGPYKSRDSVELQITCKEHHQFLTQIWGLDNHKSETLKWKDCPEEFLPHLVRGYFDGDGSIYTKQSTNPNVRTVGINFVGTHHFISGLQKAINKSNSLPEGTGHIEDLDTYAALVYNGNDTALKILDWMFLESTELTRLDRKFEKYAEYKKYIESVTVYDAQNKSRRYVSTIIPDYELSQKIRFDYEYLDLDVNKLSLKYNVNRSTLDSIIKNITHTKSDNRSNHAKIYITAFGETKHILDWVNDERCVVDIGTLRDRIKNQGMDPEVALAKLPDSTSGTIKHFYEIDGEQKSISEILKEKKISRSAFNHRVHNIGLDAKTASELAPGSIKRVNHAIDKLSNNQKNTQSSVEYARELYSEGKTVKEISEITNMTESSLYDIMGGRTFQSADYKPVNKNQDTIFITHNGRTQTIKAWADETGIPYSTIDRRWRRGLASDQVLHTGQARLNLGKVQSKKDKAAHQLAFNLRTDYKKGLIGKALYAKYGIPKSRAMDIISNRTCKEADIWWK